MRTRQAGQSALLLLDVVEVLEREAIQYAVIGAFALAALGKVRGTTDVDALLSISYKRLVELRSVFAATGFETELAQGGMDDPISGVLVLSDSYANHVELLADLKGVDPQIFARTFEIAFLDQPLHIVSREDFIAMKCFAGGPQDIQDAMSAYQATEGPLDFDLLRTLTRRFGRAAADNLEQIVAGA